MNIREQLIRDEGCKLHAYRDSMGLWTIGVGTLIDPKNGAHPPAEMKMPNGVIDTFCSISQDVANRLLDDEIARVTAELKRHLSWFDHLTEARQGVLINMGYNLGLNGLLGFHQTLQAIEHGLYATAARLMLDSRWATQVGQRAVRLAEQIRTGEFV